jgi:hypothetical protein
MSRVLPILACVCFQNTFLGICNDSVSPSDSNEGIQDYALDRLSTLALHEGAGMYSAILSSECPQKLYALISSSDHNRQINIFSKLVWCALDEEGVQLMAKLVQWA